MNEEIISFDNVECTLPSLTFVSVVISLCAISLVVNAVVSIKLGHTKLTGIAAIGIRAICMTSVINVLIILMGTCLAAFTCYLHNLIVCIVQGLLTRLGNTAAHLSIALFYTESLFWNLSGHRGIETGRLVLLIFTIIWIVVTCVSEAPVFPVITYTFYRSSFSCDILDRNALMISDSLVYGVIGFLILSISIFMVCTNPRSLKKLSSYVVGDINHATQIHCTWYVGKPGCVLALVLLLEWIVRMAAAIVPDSRMSNSLFSFNMVVMLIRYIHFPAILFTIVNHHHNSITAPTAGASDMQMPCPIYEETTIVRRISVTVSSGGGKLEVLRSEAALDVAIDQVVKARKDAAEMNIQCSV